MFGHCGIGLPCFGRQRRRRYGSDEEVREPVLLVSGIGGSILNSKRKDKGSQMRVWVRILFSNYEFKKCLWSIYNPETGYTETLNLDIEIVVPEDDYGLHAVDILDPAWRVKLLLVTDVYHFHDMIDMLIDCGYKKGSTLFGYGYDFHQSNRIDQAMNGLKMKLQTAYKASGGKKVPLAASMIDF
ncbi:Phospholipase A(1) LCAT3 [Apostasia shenzhenica]|uniref:Phospholipase A(1) LCAT3 n=1 Tax=Apostasia shenzhenica TaxID=1088818 RepID=A0A2I0AGT6_9ASPA|nr:Phospholipase A(1) LCAT3 [Apostasia shenzhenica]